MLNQILTEFENTTGGLCLEEIAQRIGKDPRVVSGALDLLINMGKLDQIQTGMCNVCPVRSICNVVSDPKRMYILTAYKPT
jgi:hypothetical protein